MRRAAGLSPAAVALPVLQNDRAFDPSEGPSGSPRRATLELTAGPIKLIGARGHNAWWQGCKPSDGRAWSHGPKPALPVPEPPGLGPGDHGCLCAASRPLGGGASL